MDYAGCIAIIVNSYDAELGRIKEKAAETAVLNFTIELVTQLTPGRFFSLPTVDRLRSWIEPEDLVIQNVAVVATNTFVQNFINCVIMKLNVLDPNAYGQLVEHLVSSFIFAEKAGGNDERLTDVIIKERIEENPWLPLLAYYSLHYTESVSGATIKNVTMED